jgi:mono/diheme cytochrome c family protein
LSGEAQVAPDRIERGALLFQRACAGCHGANGAGSEQNGDIRLAINSPSFLALISDQAVRRIIITGRPDLGMPTYAERDGRPDDFQPLTTSEIDDIVSLIASWRMMSNFARHVQQ